MNTKNVGLIIALGCVICFSAVVVGSVQSPFQSPDTIPGISIVAQVQTAASDTQSIAVQTLVPGYVSYINQYLPESVAFTGAGLNQLDPKRLYFLFDYAPRVYYIYEGACYNNALGATIATVSNPTNSILSGNSFLIFPDVCSSTSAVCASGSGVRSLSEPLLAGDFVQLPTVKAGQQLSFFIEANLSCTTSHGTTSCTPQAIYYNGASMNPDNYQHMVAFFPDNSQYIIICFEDMYGGGDKDCNDLCFIVDVGPQNSLVMRNPNTLPK